MPAWIYATIFCMKNGMSRQPHHTLRDYLTNQRLRLQVNSLLLFNDNVNNKADCEEMLGHPENCIFSASHCLISSQSWPIKKDKPIFKKMAEIAARFSQYMCCTCVTLADLSANYHKDAATPHKEQQQVHPTDSNAVQPKVSSGS